MRVLLVEDNEKISTALTGGLVAAGFPTDVAASGVEGEELASSGNYDIAVVDVMLPDRSGIEVCRNLRRRGVQSKILMLTGLSGVQDKIRGLDAGADDCVTKPFDLDELVARFRALMRRGDAGASRYLRFDDLKLDIYSRQAVRADKEIQLSNRESALLEVFMRNPNRPLARGQIAERVWGQMLEEDSNLIDVYVASLRRKCDYGFPTQLIHTVRGVGYRFGSL
ncbi:MAG: response regulator transcription factor [Phycisphaeraceae bacterium]|nr:response regulator transcription factor [Phycisphaeraceae bacterium]